MSCVLASARAASTVNISEAGDLPVDDGNGSSAPSTLTTATGGADTGSDRRADLARERHGSVDIFFREVREDWFTVQ